MPNITIDSLKKGADSLGLEYGPSIKKKELETLITEELSKRELGYECPSCGKDIPDVEICPFCGENFMDDEEASQPESTNEVNDVPVNTEVGQEAPEQQEVRVEGKVEDTTNEPEDLVEPPKNKDRKTGPKKEDKKIDGNIKEEYDRLIGEIIAIVGPDATRVENKSGDTFKIGKKRLLKATSSTKSISIEFNVVLQTENENIKTFTEEEAKAKHLGTVRAIYSFGDFETAIALVKEAYNIMTDTKEEVEA